MEIGANCERRIKKPGRKPGFLVSTNVLRQKRDWRYDGSWRKR